MIRCDFCGFEFDPSCNTESGCSGCPVAKSCTHVVCPRCGYQMLPEARLIGWLRKAREGMSGMRIDKKGNL